MPRNKVAPVWSWTGTMGELMKKLILIAGIATALALTSSANAGVNLVVNGDFSNPSLSAGQWIAGASGAYGWYNDNKSDWVEKVALTVPAAPMLTPPVPSGVLPFTNAATTPLFTVVPPE